MSTAPIGGNTPRLSSGTKVRIVTPGPPPDWVEADDDRGRTSNLLKRRLIEQFFRGDRKISAEIFWVTSESERDELARKGRTKVRIKEPAGSALVITAPVSNLQKV